MTDRTPGQDLERELGDVEFAKCFGAARAKTEFALTLAKARIKLNITQKEMADMLGCSLAYISKLERGDANPTLGTVGKLLAVLGLCLVMDTAPLAGSGITSSQNHL